MSLSFCNLKFTHTYNRHIHIHLTRFLSPPAFLVTTVFHEGKIIILCLPLLNQTLRSDMKTFQ